MNSQLSYALSAGASLAELRFERSISSEASVKTEGFSLTSTESHARGRGPRCLTERDLGFIQLGVASGDITERHDPGLHDPVQLCEMHLSRRSSRETRVVREVGAPHSAQI